MTPPPTSSRSTEGPDGFVDLVTTDELAEYIRATEKKSDLRGSRAVLLALLWHAARNFRNRRSFIVGRRPGAAVVFITSYAFILAVAACVGFALALAVLWIAGLAGWSPLLYTVGLILLALPIVGPIYVRSPEVSLSRTRGGRVRHLRWGRLSQVLNPGTQATLLLCLGMASGVQTGLIWQSDGHLGLAAADSPWAAGRTVLQNTVAVPIAVVEPYTGQLLPSLDGLTRWGGAVFSAFRLIYAGLLGAFVYSLLRYVRLKRVLVRGPDLDGPAALIVWAGVFTDSPHGREYQAEAVFTTLSLLYLGGHYDACRLSAEMFRSLAVSEEIRSLFVHPETGKRLFPSGPTRKRRRRNAAAG